MCKDCGCSEKNYKITLNNCDCGNDDECIDSNCECKEYYPDQIEDLKDAYKKFIVPIGEDAEKALHELISSYKDTVNWDDSYGELKIDGESHVPYKKSHNIL